MLCNNSNECYNKTSGIVLLNGTLLLEKTVNGALKTYDNRFLGKNYNIFSISWFNTEYWALNTYTESRTTNLVDTAQSYCNSRGLRLPTKDESFYLKDSALYSTLKYWTSSISYNYYGPNHYRFLFNQNIYNIVGDSGDDQAFFVHAIICVK
ncbi:hypothetical protein [Aliarcobacter butzleri]|uniref:hypothetical protein n=1 Tax=Aliarcobacter butzleri TaxID=28197 RepID=UPI00126996EF|nr:hypothetical protein [Aliarcobacter butzleri]